MQVGQSQVLQERQSLSPISQEELDEWARLSPADLKTPSRGGQLEQFFREYCREEQIRVAQQNSSRRSGPASSEEVLRAYRQRGTLLGRDSEVPVLFENGSPRLQGGPSMSQHYARLNQSYQAYMEYLKQQQYGPVRQASSLLPQRRVAGTRESQPSFVPQSAKESFSEDIFAQPSDSQIGVPQSAWVSLSPAAYYLRLLSLNYTAHPYRGRPDYLIDRVVQIQAVWRGWITRKKLLLASVINRAAIFIQCVFRGRITRKRTRPLLKQIHKLRLMDVKKKQLALEQTKQQNVSQEQSKLRETQEEALKRETEAKSLEAKISQLEEMNIKMREKLEQQSELMMNFLAGQNLNQIQSSQQILQALNEHFNRMAVGTKVTSVDKPKKEGTGTKADKKAIKLPEKSAENPLRSANSPADERVKIDENIQKEAKESSVTLQDASKHVLAPLGMNQTPSSPTNPPTLSLGDKLKAIRLSQSSSSQATEGGSLKALLDKKPASLLGLTTPPARTDPTTASTGAAAGQPHPELFRPVSTRQPATPAVQQPVPTQQQPEHAAQEQPLSAHDEAEAAEEQPAAGDEEHDAPEDEEDEEVADEEAEEEALDQSAAAEEEEAEAEDQEEEQEDCEEAEGEEEELSDQAIEEASEEQEEGEEESFQEPEPAAPTVGLSSTKSVAKAALSAASPEPPAQQRPSASSSSKVATSGYALSTLNKINQLLPMSSSQKKLFANLGPSDNNLSASDRSQPRDTGRSHLQNQYQRHSLLSGKMSTHSGSSSSLHKGSNTYHVNPSTMAFNTLYSKGSGSKSGSRILDQKKPSAPKVDDLGTQPNSSDQRHLQKPEGSAQPKPAAAKPDTKSQPQAPKQPSSTSSTLRSILKSTTSNSYRPAGSSVLGQTTSGRLGMPKR